MTNKGPAFSFCLILLILFIFRFTICHRTYKRMICSSCRSVYCDLKAVWILLLWRFLFLCVKYSVLNLMAPSPSQLFTEYGRLAMDEIFLKPFQVRESNDDVTWGFSIASVNKDFFFLVVNVLNQRLELSLWISLWLQRRQRFPG